jgi:uncharacterized membrane protein
MGVKRSLDLGDKSGLPGFIEKLRYHEAARQGIGLLLVLLCGFMTEPAGETRIMVGFAMALIGQIWRIYAAGVIYKNRKLATTGAYSLVRHPLYLGNFIILAGFTLACANWMFVVLFVIFFLFYYPPAIRYEDAKLENIFGEEWRTWSAAIPAMIPNRLRWTPNQEAVWNIRQSLIRNGELIITVYLAGCAFILWYYAAS